MRTTTAPFPRHPKGSGARVLLCSVFGPYACDDAYGSRAVNPMELYQNQVTRAQGVFSLRMFHRSWGLMLIQANLEAPCTVLDFPTLERFESELRETRYDVVGIGAIPPNLGKVAAMCDLVRRLQPEATIVVGGHVANHPAVAELLDCDHVVRGEGVAWFRRYLGEDEDRPLRHPLIVSGFGTRIVGMRGSDHPSITAATVIPSVGCPLGCDFCATSAMFGGKGRFVSFYETGDQVFALMSELEAALGTKSFFVMDENFLLHRRRALRLLELMRQHERSWSLLVFSSADALRRYTMDELVSLGVSWVWMGLEGDGASYAKLRGADTRALVRELQAHGIRVLGSSIVGLPEHTPENVGRAIEHAVSHDTDFHQFMLFTPVPGTPLWHQHRDRGTLLGEDECPTADVHGQSRFNFTHPHLKDGNEGRLLLDAFSRDLERNGPSIVRMLRTLLAGRRRHRHHPERRVRERFDRECRSFTTSYPALLWAVEKWHRRGSAERARVRDVREEAIRQFGWLSKLVGRVLGPVVLLAMHLEKRRLLRGWTYEPPTFYETNRRQDAGRTASGRRLSMLRWVDPCADAPERAARTA